MRRAPYAQLLPDYSIHHTGSLLLFHLYLCSYLYLLTTLENLLVSERRLRRWVGAEGSGRSSALLMCLCKSRVKTAHRRRRGERPNQLIPYSCGENRDSNFSSDITKGWYLGSDETYFVVWQCSRAYGFEKKKNRVLETWWMNKESSQVDRKMHLFKVHTRSRTAVLWGFTYAGIWSWRMFLGDESGTYQISKAVGELYFSVWNSGSGSKWNLQCWWKALRLPRGAFVTQFLEVGIFVM